MQFQIKNYEFYMSQQYKPEYDRLMRKTTQYLNNIAHIGNKNERRKCYWIGQMVKIVRKTDKLWLFHLNKTKAGRLYLSKHKTPNI